MTYQPPQTVGELEAEGRAERKAAFRALDLQPELVAALEACERAINDNSRSAGISVIGFNALRAQLASAGRLASEALAKVPKE